MVAHSAPVHDFAWGDARNAVFSSVVGGYRQLHSLDLTGHDIRLLTESPSNKILPQYFGKTLLYIDTGINSPSSFDLDLLSDINGGFLRRHHSNEWGRLSWTESTRFSQILQTYQDTGDTFYLRQAIETANALIMNVDSARGILDSEGAVIQNWSTTRYSFDHTTPHVSLITSAMLASPLTELLLTIKGTSFESELDTRLLEQILLDIVNYYEQDYRTTDNDEFGFIEPGEGYYVIRKCSPSVVDGANAPFNFQSRFGTFLIHMHRLTGNEEFLDKAVALGNLLKRHLSWHEQHGAYHWNYWWGIGETGWSQADNVSCNSPTYPGHATYSSSGYATLDVEFMTELAKEGVVFGDGELLRLASTKEDLEGLIDFEDAHLQRELIRRQLASPLPKEPSQATWFLGAIRGDDFEILQEDVLYFRPDGQHGIALLSRQENQSFGLSFITTTPDDSPPLPDPSIWLHEPHSLTPSSIRMVAATAIDPDANGIEYYFEETTGNPGGTDSGWQDSNEYVDEGLYANTIYSYRVKTRDKSFYANEGAYSDSVSTSYQLTGTAGDDTVVFEPGETCRVILNGDAYVLPTDACNQFVFDSLAGTDTVTVKGTAGDDLAYMWPERGKFHGQGYSAVFENTEVIRMVGDGLGHDVAYLWDSTGNDLFEAWPDFVRLSGPVFLNSAEGMRTVYAHATSGGTNDRADFYDGPFDDDYVVRVGTRDAWMTGNSYYNYATGFSSVSAYATASGANRASFFDGPTDDYFVARVHAQDAYIQGPDFFGYARGFESNMAYATQGSDNDRAEFFDGPSDDYFVIRVHAHDAYIQAPGYFGYASGFDRNRAFANHGGSRDRAEFYDGPGDDYFVVRAYVHDAYIQSAGFYGYARGFERNQAYATHGGTNNRAEFYDSPSDDYFVVRVSAGDAFLQSAGFYGYARGFQRNQAYAMAGGTYDEAEFYDGPSDDYFAVRVYAQDAYIQSAGFYGYARGFQRNQAYATSGGTQDQADFYDGPGDDHYVARVHAQDAYIQSAGFYGYARGFERNQAYATSGGASDRVDFYSGPEIDQFVARLHAQDAYIQSPSYYGYARGFERVSAFGSGVGVDLAQLFDSPGDDVLDATINGVVLRSGMMLVNAEGFHQFLVHGSLGYDVGRFFNATGQAITQDQHRNLVAFVLRALGIWVV